MCALSLLGSAMSNADVAGLVRPSGSLDRDPLAPYEAPLDERTAAHLLRRAGFGGSPDEIARYATMAPAFAARTLVTAIDASSDPWSGAMFDPRAEYATIVAQYPPSDTAHDLQRRLAYSAVGREMAYSVNALRVWWLDRMLTTAAPLQEKMTFFFHGHFTTAAIEKGVWPSLVWNQNQLFRSHALGNLRDLTLAVSRDPAMLLYLDNALNVQAHPNENYARELMELFTLGRGNYTEDDVREAARALTGWTFDRRSASFVFAARNHDDGVKHFLGQTGAFDGSDVVRIIYEQPACSRFWANALLGAFVYSDPEPELVDDMAALIRAHDYELAPVMLTLLQSRVFYSDRAYRALVKSPVEFAIGTYKTLGIPLVDRDVTGSLNQMGQTLFYPPNVAGWPGGQNWITSQTLIARHNFVARLVNAQANGVSALWLDALPVNAGEAANRMVSVILQGDAAPEAMEQLTGFLNGDDASAMPALSGENVVLRMRGGAYLTMTMPAYQLN
jgi:uncharacterized protein (DUF1800 family)